MIEKKGSKRRERDEKQKAAYISAWSLSATPLTQILLRKLREFRMKLSTHLSVLFLSCSSMIRLKGSLGTLMWRPAPCFGWKKFRRSQFFSFIHSLFLAFLMLTRGRLVRGPETRNRNHLKAICQIMCLFPCEQAKRVFKTRKVDACVWFPIPLIKKGYTTTERHLSQQKDPEDPF